MKRTKQIGLYRIACYALAITIAFTACKKGDPGPQGPKGDTGATGANGAKGDKGDKGDAGTANVYYSAWKDAAFVLDTANAVYFTQFAEAKVTDNILSSGEIKVYINLGTPANKVVSPLPYIQGNVQIRPYYAMGTIEVDANVNVSTVTVNGDKHYQYRYIIIPGGQAIRMSTKVDWNNYAEVQAYLGLKD